VDGTDKAQAQALFGGASLPQVTKAVGTRLPAGNRSGVWIKTVLSGLNAEGLRLLVR
jgi:hypothetical protein